MHDMEEIAEIVHCCFLLHSMVIEEKVRSCNDKPELANINDCIEKCNVAEEHAGSIATMTCIQDEDDALSDCQLEIEYLAFIGINIYVATISPRDADDNVLDSAVEWQIRRSVIRVLRDMHI